MVVNIVLGVLIVLFIVAIIVDGRVESETSELFKGICGSVLIAFIVIVGIALMVVVSKSGNYESVTEVNADTSCKLIQSKITDKASENSSLSGWTAFHFGSIQAGSSETEKSYYEFYCQDKGGKIQEKKVDEKDISIRYTDGEPKYQIETETHKLKEPYFQYFGVFSYFTVSKKNYDVLCVPQGSIQQQYDFSKSNSK